MFIGAGKENNQPFRAGLNGQWGKRIKLLSVAPEASYLFNIMIVQRTEANVKCHVIPHNFLVLPPWRTYQFSY